jgi:hypothetical protein
VIRVRADETMGRRGGKGGPICSNKPSLKAQIQREKRRLYLSPS